MLVENENDYIQSYENALIELNASPDDREFQHKAVLALARAGSLNLALAQYRHFGLNTVRHHEDIMALGGRLTKDLYLSASGKKSLEYARDSAQLYEAAFQDTKGYYSGINAATMAMMAQMPPETIFDRAKAIMHILPKSGSPRQKDHYFIEATRAECHLLMGDFGQAQKSLESAITFDPLNYTAHATTLKQFKMVLAKLDEGTEWLSKFTPPTAMHYAGHIRLNESGTNLDDLKLSVADKIQQHDIGVGYGALAAGSDIIIAEALLEEGGELHVILPCNTDKFLEHSVKPFGEHWVARFNACLAKASSLNIAANSAPWPNLQINQLVAKHAMGKAIMQCQHFSVTPCQLLIWDETPKSSYTAVHAADWHRTGKTQIIVPIKSAKSGTQPITQKQTHSFILSQSDVSGLETFKTAPEAFKAAKRLRDINPEIRLGLHVNIEGVQSELELNKILEHGLPQSTLMSEIFASILSLESPEYINVSFAGLIKKDEASFLRCYAANL